MTKQQLYRLILTSFIEAIVAMLKKFVLALPIGIVAASVSLLAIKIYQVKTGRHVENKRRTAIALLAGYVTVMIQMSVFFRPFGSIRQVDLIPFDMPGGARYIVLYALANALAFFPVGILVPIIWKKIDSIKFIVMIGLGGSLIIEITQLSLQCGVFQTEDLIMNTVGAVAGYFIYKKWHK